MTETNTYRLTPKGEALIKGDPNNDHGPHLTLREVLTEAERVAAPDLIVPPNDWVQSEIMLADQWLDLLESEGDYPEPDLALRASMETAMAFELRRLHDEFNASRARAHAIAEGFVMQQAALSIQILRREAVLKELLHIRIREAGKGAKKSVRVPGAGTFSLRKAGGRWSIPHPEAALTWLEGRGIGRPEFLQPRELLKSALHSRLQEIILWAGGEIPDGVELSPEVESFSFKAEE